MSSLYWVFSTLRWSVPSTTDLSRATMPPPRALISEVSAATPSLASSMAASVSEMVRSRPFFLSSAESNCAAQNCCLWSSSSCSCLSMTTMSSHILMTWSKPPCERAFLPVSVSAKRSRRGRLSTLACWRMERIMARARVCWEVALTRTCIRLAAELGSVCLNRSRASSSFSTLMVSARATSSSARVFMRSSRSCVLVEQLFSSSARNFLSWMRADSVSVRSFFISTMATPSSPIWPVLASTVADRAATSFFLAAIRAS
mmetsp:Transcript_21012/g.68053  ORF Transcript_21012/g.68053 Transcript_21012/m.68053 type:complete len:259 (-) Transcript_21012:153-929(-)